MTKKSWTWVVVSKNILKIIFTQNLGKIHPKLGEDSPILTNIIIHVSGQIIATSHDLKPQMVVKSKGNFLISGKSRLVKYYNLARCIPGTCFVNVLYFVAKKPSKKRAQTPIKTEVIWVPGTHIYASPPPKPTFCLVWTHALEILYIYM